MNLAPVPETSIDKNHDARGPEDHVCNHARDRFDMNPVSETQSMESGPQPKLRSGVLLPVGDHY